jgi:hypothetical protein
VSAVCVCARAHARGVLEYSVRVHLTSLATSSKDTSSKDTSSKDTSVRVHLTSLANEAVLACCNVKLARPTSSPSWMYVCGYTYMGVRVRVRYLYTCGLGFRV